MNFEQLVKKPIPLFFTQSLRDMGVLSGGKDSILDMAV